jgi:hypothetical protein
MAHMTGAHLHLLVNHIPILGSLFALALLVASIWFAPDVLRRVALVLLIGVGIGGAVANFTGEPAEDAIRQFPGVRRELITNTRRSVNSRSTPRQRSASWHSQRWCAGGGSRCLTRRGSACSWAPSP